MTTQIVKLNSQNDDVGGFFSRMAKKIGIKSNYDVTLIMKKSAQSENEDSKDITLLNNDEINELLSRKGIPRTNTGSQTKSRRDSKRVSQLIVQRSTKFLLPNIKISQSDVPEQIYQPASRRNIVVKSGRTSILNRDQEAQKVQNAIMSINKYEGSRRNSSCPRKSILTNRSVSVSVQTEVNQYFSAENKKRQERIREQQDQESSSFLTKQPTQQKEDQIKMQDFLKGNYGTTYMRSDKNDSNNESGQEDDDDDSNAESQFLIENKLNQAIKFIEKDQLYQLQDFLYEFKDHYNYLSDRIQIKWRLLMAYCKENRKEYERAAINYNQVIQISKQSPKSLSIDFADVYHRLGICYAQIKQWNSGITSFGKALNQYKRSKKNLKFAECINNLGTLYLHAGHVSEAQECFLSSFYIKQEELGKDSIRLFSTLLNLFQCNVMSKNYDQAENMLKILQRITNKIPDNDLLLGSVYRRKGKLSFLAGKLKDAQKNFAKSNDILKEKYPYCLQFGELMNCMAILRLQQHKYHESKQLFDKASILINFYCSKQSSAVKTLKKNTDLVLGYLRKVQQKNHSNNHLKVL